MNDFSFLTASRSSGLGNLAAHIQNQQHQQMKCDNFNFASNDSLLQFAADALQQPHPNFRSPQLPVASRQISLISNRDLWQLDQQPFSAAETTAENADAFEPIPIGHHLTIESPPSLPSVEIDLLRTILSAALGKVIESEDALDDDELSSPLPAPDENQRGQKKRSQSQLHAASAKRHRASASGPRFRAFQEKQWEQQFRELIEFKQEKGHCLVPHSYDKNPTLSRWVKRQRYQYKLLKEGKSATMNDARIQKLEEAGFVWDSHAATWQERYDELQAYLAIFGHCNVPSNNPENPQLATWVKCQRRQCKLFWNNGQSSNMTLERIHALDQLGFTWKLRRDNCGTGTTARAML